MPPKNGARRELAFGTDVPHIGHVTDRKSGTDQHQRCRLHDKLLDRPARSQRLDEVDVKRLKGIEAKQGENDAAGNDGQAQGNEGRGNRHDVGIFTALFKHDAHRRAP